MRKVKYATILSNMGACNDRYCADRYSKKLSVEHMFEKASKIDKRVLVGLNCLTVY